LILVFSYFGNEERGNVFSSNERWDEEMTLRESGIERDVLENEIIELYRSSIDNAGDFSEIWKIVKKTVADSLGKHRVSMSLYLDDLPIHLGAYHPIGTNNIVLNRTLIHIVERVTESTIQANAFIYSLLLHEYLHAIGYVREEEVRTLVYGISRECFGEDHVTTKLAKEGPWTLLKGVPLKNKDMSRIGIKIVKDFDNSNQTYIT
jgi:hypothetical protein